MGCRRHRALAAGAAAACLVLCGCGGSAAPAAAGGTSTAAGTTSDGKFCTHAASFMRHIPQGPATKHPTAAQEKANMQTVLAATITGYSSLQKQAPAALQKPLSKIVRIYRADERALQSASTMAEVSDAMVRNSRAGATNFSKVLRYISAHCK